MSPANAVVMQGQQASDSRIHSEDLKKVAGDEVRQNTLGLAPAGKAQLCLTSGEKARKHVTTVAQLAVHRIGEGHLRRAMNHADGPRIRDVEQSKPIRMAHRKRAKEYGVGESKNGSVGANAERNREHGDGGKSGRID
jgi:hypothetical protein